MVENVCSIYDLYGEFIDLKIYKNSVSYRKKNMSNVFF